MERVIERHLPHGGRTLAEREGGHDPEKNEDDNRNMFRGSPPDSAGFKDRIAHFTWPWFATTMSTGALAVVLGQTPNKFDGLQTIGKIFFILDLVLFALFSIAMFLRAYWFPRRFLASLHHPVEGLFFGSYWVSVSLILNCMQAYGVPNSGPWLIKCLNVLFWIYCAVVLCVAIGQYYVLFQEERLRITDAVPAWIFPIYPLLVIGPMAGTMVPSQPHHAALPMWVGAVMLQGLAWIVALMMYAMYMQRLMTSSLPAPSTRPGMYVSVGPAGYTAAGLISLGVQAPSVLYTDAFTQNAIPDGDIVRVIGTMAGIFVILFAFWFFCISSVAVIAGLNKMSFTLNWWAVSFLPLSSKPDHVLLETPTNVFAPTVRLPQRRPNPRRDPSRFRPAKSRHQRHLQRPNDLPRHHVAHHGRGSYPGVVEGQDHVAWQGRG
jgi:C4-dicarboxylate transporter/malic acid transport protein